MLVVLEAVAGPIAGRKIEIRAGSILRIGRTPKSDYPVGEDSYLSGQHFAVECDGTECRVRDLGSSNGTFVNGDRITERVVTQGDSLVAGGSTFTVHIEQTAGAAAPPGTRVKTASTAVYTGPHRLPERASPAVTGEVGLGWPGFSRPQSTLLTALFKEDDHVYAVLDASRDSRIAAFLQASGEPYTPLDAAERVAGYVVSLRPESRLLDVLIKDGWGRGWGFYCTTGAGIEEISKHWSSFLFLRTPDGKSLTFRFWDPRILRALIPLMSAPEVAEFFGPASRILVEGEKAEIALELSLGPRGARQQALVLL